MQKSIYPGDNFRNLAKYLNRPKRQDDSSSVNLPPTLFATVYCLQADIEIKDLQCRDLRLEDELSDAIVSLSGESDSANFLMFLRGHPTPEWLNTIGAQFKVDPEYFRHHMDFNLSPGTSNWFSSPSLPSVSSNFITIRITTIGHRKHVGHLADNSIKAARERANGSMVKFLNQLQNFDSDVGTSFVRRCSIHDSEYFTIEQNISLCCSRNNKSWTGMLGFRQSACIAPKLTFWTVLAWLDSGKNLDRGIEGPWMTENLLSHLSRLKEVSLLPVIRHYPRIAFNTHRYARPSQTQQEAREGFQQTRSVLNQNYGKELNRAVMAKDSFFVVHDLFSFKAFAEVQFLNLVESVLSRETDVAVLNRKPSVENLLFHKELLASHARALRENIESIKSRGGPDWDRLTPEDDAKLYLIAKEHSGRLLKDYEWLLQRTEELSASCDRGIQDSNTRVMMEETLLTSQRSADTARLTNVATFSSFIYVPLSITSGFFGMNFKAFGQGNLQLWLWPIVTVPVVLLSSLVLLIFIRWGDLRDWKGLTLRRKRRITVKGDVEMEAM